MGTAQTKRTSVWVEYGYFLEQQIVELLLLFTDWHTKCVPFVFLFLSKTELVRQIYQMDTKAKSTSQNQKGMVHEVVVRN